ncbi:MAG: hypothetical protein ACRDID_07380 [Ktedonobacterales bacterium]
MATEPHEQSDDNPPWPSLTDVALSGLRDMDAADKADKNERRLLSGSALGVCIAIMLALLGLPRLDQSLDIALIALAVAAPLLILDFVFAPAHPKHGPAYLLRQGLWFAAWVVGVGIGIVAVVVGIGAIIWHLYTTAVFVLIGSLVGSFVLLWCLALPITFFLWWRRLRQDKKNEKTPSDD